MNSYKQGNDVEITMESLKSEVWGPKSEIRVLLSGKLCRGINEVGKSYCTDQ